VDPPGVGASTGAPKHTVAETARSVLAFVDALGLREIDLLGFSLGGFVAQDLALLRPWAIRRLVLVGTGPKGAPGMRHDPHLPGRGARLHLPIPRGGGAGRQRVLGMIG
jgi:pimeloyl-ACP methyl ester carboxylesterase